MEHGRRTMRGSRSDFRVTVAGKLEARDRFHLGDCPMCGCFPFVPSEAFSMLLHLLSAWKADHYGLHPLCWRWLPVMFSQWEAGRRLENRQRERFGILPMPNLSAVAAFVQLRQWLVGQPSPVLLLLLASPCPFMPGDGLWQLILGCLTIPCWFS